MKRNAGSIHFRVLVVTFLLVKVVKYLADFHYNIWEEGVFTAQFLVDVLIWGAVYTVVLFIWKRAFPEKQME